MTAEEAHKASIESKYNAIIEGVKQSISEGLYYYDFFGLISIEVAEKLEKDGFEIKTSTALFLPDKTTIFW